MLKNFITPDQVKESTRGLIEQAIGFKSKIPLNCNEGETDAAGMIYEVSGIVYFAVAILDNDNRIVRFEEVTPIDELIENIIKKL